MFESPKNFESRTQRVSVSPSEKYLEISDTVRKAKIYFGRPIEMPETVYGWRDEQNRNFHSSKENFSLSIYENI